MFPPIRKCCWKELDGLRPQGDLPPIVWQLNALWSTCLETSKVRIKHQRAKSDTTNQRPDFQHRQLVGGWVGGTISVPWFRIWVLWFPILVPDSFVLIPDSWFLIPGY